ncbi:MAG: GntR family transcriptional regulator [Hyphomicrobiales bacterium]|nr:MAG: GntR family transcriptional regulator [Hyphomicrobiales bacterium]
MPDVNQEALTPIRLEVAPLRTRIIDVMRQAIERGTLQPGQRLVEKDLCLQLGVSRTSLREALRGLEAERVIAPTSARGLTVVKIKRRDAENIYRIRADLEALIAEQYMARASDEEIVALSDLCDELAAAYKGSDVIEIVELKRRFYNYACAVADNEIALDFLSRLTLRTAQLRFKSTARRERQLQSLAEIKNLADAIRKRDVVAVTKAVRTHVMNAANSALPFAE